MTKMIDNIDSPKISFLLYRNYWIHAVLAFLLISILLISISIPMTMPVEAKPIKDKNIKQHDKTGDINSKECKDCHDKINQDTNQNSNRQQATTGVQNKLFIGSASISSNNIAGGMRSIGNLTAILEIGQTPYQLGPFFRGWYYGWSWWDNDDFGSEKQKNLIALMVLDNTTGTAMPITGLTTRPIWPQASYRQHSGVYSYKADIGPSPITTLKNYPDNTEIWMIKEINLTGISNASLTFWTWYSMETEWDYGYVAISTNGNNWINLPGTLTTNTNPNGNNLGNGITGSSSGWVQETMSLTPYVGSKILLGFRFKSDAAVNQEGWYVDDILLTGGGTTIFSDNSETPTAIKTLNANVTYPHLTIINATDPLTGTATLQYTYNIQQVSLQEDIGHPGTYIGYFKYDPFAEQYSGNYDVTLDTVINGTSISISTQFQTTIFGCQSCHNKQVNNVETSLVHGEGGGMQSCTYICHGGSRGLYGDNFMDTINANPIHVHEMKYGHRGGFLQGAYYPQPPYDVPSHVTNTTCEQCHTSFLHDNTGTDTTKIASYTLHGTNINFSLGVHQGLTCENCHGNLSYPSIPQGQYQLNGKLGNYSPSFTSYEAFTDTYIVNVSGININGGNGFNVTVTGSGTTKTVSLYVIGPADNTTTGLQGPCWVNTCYRTQNLETPINLNIANPYKGTWLVKLIQLQEGAIDYTISSSYPIERKPIIKIPECSNCHNSNGQIPNWNPGYAHADSNGDGNLDVQCRMCHGAMHDIVVKKCQDCHTVAPTGHIIAEPTFSQYITSQCLSCHDDPHVVKSEVDSCIECHGTNYTGASPSVSDTFVDIGKFNTSIHQNINSTVPDTVTNEDCWTCHYNKNMYRDNIRKCRDCHKRVGQWHGNANITANLTELSMGQ